MKNLFLYISLVIAMLLPGTVSSQKKDSNFLKDLLWKKSSSQLRNIFKQPDTFRYQLIYTKIDRDKNDHPHFKNYYYLCRLIKKRNKLF